MSLYSKFIRPREIKVGDEIFTISRIPSLDAQPIYSEVAKSIATNGIIGMTMLPKETVRQLLTYTAKQFGGEWMSIDTEEKINKAFEDMKSFQTVVIEMVKENFGFLTSGDLLDLLADKGATGSAS